MARTKAEIRAFLDSMVGTIPQHPAPYGPGSGQDLSGQCVTGIKVLMDFLGVPNPYAARGNATDVDNTLLSQGIAQDGRGWLTIVVNHDMGYINGVHYGHIWVDLQGEANYETNGAWALHTTKNTRPISQGQQFVNLDNYVQGEDMATVLNTNQARQDYLLFGIEVAGDSPALVRAVGADELEFIKGMGPQVQNNLAAKDKIIADLQAQLKAATSDGQVLSPGKYVVK